MRQSPDDAQFRQVTVPHCVTELSWQKWDQSHWADVWFYKRRFNRIPEMENRRVFLDFAAVMTSASPSINGRELPKHAGGYLPFSYEITSLIKHGENLLALEVDGRWQSVPPDGSPRGPGAVDYLQPAGITRPASLRVVPPIFISDVFAKPMKVLDADRHIEVLCTVDAAATSSAAEIEVRLIQESKIISTARQPVMLNQPGTADVHLTLSRLGDVALWDVDSPNLCHVVATLIIDGKPVHDYRARIGLRDARFELDGFFLNGRRLQIFGLNRHESFPYVGSGMPARVQRRDAWMLRRELNCNMVRCSHYPQMDAFLDACDELGMMVWEEPPGWQYIGDKAWQDLVVRDVRDMIIRDRNRPSIVIWAVRVNESANRPELYLRTKAVAKALDDSRQTTGSMTPDSRKDWEKQWHQDVFGFDDYHTAGDGGVGILDPVEGFPYMLAETVGQLNYAPKPSFTAKYRRAGDLAVQQAQALRHAEAHSKVGANSRNCGAIAWCGFDYGSMLNNYNNVKCPGVVDLFRIPKLGATFYQAQCDPKIKPVIEPNFYWDFGRQTPRGPGKHVAIFSNCDRLEVFVNGSPHASLRQDAANYPHLKHAPFFVDLELDGAAYPDLRIDGFQGGARIVSRYFSSNPDQDQFILSADDSQLIGDGSDATRLAFARVDKYGAVRPFMEGFVRFEIAGPGVLLGDNPFLLTDSGDVGAVWVKTTPAGNGRIRVQAAHSSLGTKTVEIAVIAESKSVIRI